MANVDTRALAQVVAQSALGLALTQSEQIQAALPAVARPELPEEVRAATERLVTQDPPLRSWRVWGAVWSAATGVLVLPEVQAAVQAVIGQVIQADFLPIATAVLGVIWPLVSKLRDARPVRGAAP